jgi:hypothetical protein
MVKSNKLVLEDTNMLSVIISNINIVSLLFHKKNNIFSLQADVHIFVYFALLFLMC